MATFARMREASVEGRGGVRVPNQIPILSKQVVGTGQDQNPKGTAKVSKTLLLMMTHRHELACCIETFSCTESPTILVKFQVVLKCGAAW